MATWAIASVIAFAGLLATLVALFTGGRSEVRGPREPDWLVPSPVDVRRARFPITWRGYDPAHVDVYLDALAAAYEELYFAAGPSAAARARERLALRLGRVTGRTSEPEDRATDTTDRASQPASRSGSQTPQDPDTRSSGS